MWKTLLRFCEQQKKGFISGGTKVNLMQRLAIFSWTPNSKRFGPKQDAVEILEDK